MRAAFMTVKNSADAPNFRKAHRTTHRQIGQHLFKTLKRLQKKNERVRLADWHLPGPSRQDRRNSGSGASEEAPV